MLQVAMGFGFVAALQKTGAVLTAVPEPVTTAIGVALVAISVGVTIYNINKANNANQQADQAKENIEEKARAVAPAPTPPDNGEGEKEKQSDKQSTSSNQMNQQVKKGKAPKSVDRVDTANTNVKGEQDHIHFKDGNALNKDGSWKEGTGRSLSNAEKQWITDNNWTLPTD